MSTTGQQNIAQVMQRNQQLEDSLVRLKARIFDAEEAIQQQTRNMQGLIQDAHLLAAVVNEHGTLDLRRKIVQAAPSFGDGLIKTEDAPAPALAPAPAPAPAQVPVEGAAE